MNINPLELMLYIILAIAFVATVCFFCGRAYCHRKHQPMREELERLRNWKESTMGLCDKLQDGEEKADYLPMDLKFKMPKRREGCPDNYEILTQGNPRDF